MSPAAHPYEPTPTLTAQRGGLAPTATKMSFYDLQNRFWQLHAECSFKPSDSHLYFYLLGQFNAARWPDKLYRKRNQIAADLGIDFKTLDTARTRLVERGLLTYEPGDKVKSAVWRLADGSQMEGKNSPEPENSPQMEGNFSTPKGSNRPDSSQMEGKNSPLYKEEEKIVGKEEEKTPPADAASAAAPAEKKIGGVESVEISPSSLPAEVVVSTPPVAAAPPAGKMVLMKNSAVAAFPAFVEAWQQAAEANPDTYADYQAADLRHYHAALLDWSNANGKKKLDWLATIRSSMRNDAAKGQLRKLGTVPGARPAAPSQVSQRQATSAALRARYQAPASE